MTSLNRVRRAIFVLAFGIMALGVAACSPVHGQSFCPENAYQAFQAGELTFAEYQQAVAECEQQRPAGRR